MKWIACDDYKELPVGDWLVKIDKDRKPYNIAVVTEGTSDGHKMIIVGNNFSWDMGDLIAYSAFERYEPVT